MSPQYQGGVRFNCTTPPLVPPDPRSGRVLAPGPGRPERCRRYDRRMVQRPPTGTIPETPGSYQFKDAEGRVDLRRQGQVAPVPPQQLLRRPPAAPAPDRPDGDDGRDRRVDRGAQRGRGAHARAQPHQAAPPPLQRPPAGRQELPVPRHHDGRHLAPGPGHAGGQAEGHQVLRALRPRLRHPGDARPAAAHLPHPHLLGQQVRPPRPARAPLPALRHREVRRPLRRQGGGATGVHATGRRPHRLPRRQHRAGGQAPRDRTC